MIIDILIGLSAIVVVYFLVKLQRNAYRKEQKELTGKDFFSREEWLKNQIVIRRKKGNKKWKM